jgi:hypothetical protein
MTTDTTKEIAGSVIAEIESMHARAIHWNSVFEFYGIELRFLKSLVNKYSIWLDSSELIDEFVACDNKIIALQRRCADIVQLLHHHGTSLRNLMQEPLRNDVQACRDTQLKIETRHIDILKELLLLRKATFDIVEAALETQELSHIT